MLYGIVLKSYSFRITPQLPHSCHTVTPQLTFLCALPQQVTLQATQQVDRKEVVGRSHLYTGYKDLNEYLMSHKTRK